MSRTKTVLKNSSYLFFQHVVVNLISIAAIGYIARKLGARDFGIYTLAFVFPAMFSEIGSFGLRGLTIREMARNRESAINDFLGKIVPVRLVLILLMGATVAGFARMMNYGAQEVIAILIGTLVAMIEGISKIIQDVFQSFEEMGRVAVREVLVRVITAVGACYAVWSGYGVIVVCSAFVLGAIFGLLINLALYLKRFKLPRFSWDWSFLRLSMKEGFGYFLGGTASALLCKTDVFMISKLMDSTAIGIYGAASTIFYRLTIIADAISTSALPAISQLFKKDNPQCQNVFSRTQWLIWVLTLPMAVGGFILGDKLIALIYGSTYGDASTVFRMLMISLPFMSAGLLFNYALGGINRQYDVSRILILCSIANFILNAVLIKIYGIVGAAAAAICIHAGCYGFFKLRSRNLFYGGMTAKKFISILISLAALCVFLLLTAKANIALQIIVSGAAYMAAIAVTESEMRVLLLERLRHFAKA
jgi:O-antigen/teichoic acid export membrane protein